MFRPAVKGLADPNPDVWGFVTAGTSPWSATMTGFSALQVAAVASAVRLLSEAAACLPCRVVELKADGTEAEAPMHSANVFLRVRANDWTSPFELIRDLMIDALTDDRGGLVHVNRDGEGQVVELIRYRSGVMGVEYDPVTCEPKYQINTRPVALGDVLHLRAPFGRSPLGLAKDAIDTASALDSHARNLFRKGARPSGALSFPKGMGEAAVKMAIAAWRAIHEAGGESGKTAILYDGAEFKPFTFASTDAQFIENRKFQILEIARHFRVPPSMLYDMDRATWGNTEQMGREFLTYSLEPWLMALEAAFGRALFSADELLRYAVRFDRDDMTRADFATRANVVNSLVAAEIINRNEGRGWFGYGPRAGGDVFGNPNINPGGDVPPTEKQPVQDPADQGAGNAAE